MSMIPDTCVLLTSPGRNFVTLKIETDESPHGIRDIMLAAGNWPSCTLFSW